MKSEVDISDRLYYLFRKANPDNPSQYSNEEITEWAADEIYRLRANQKEEKSE